LLIIIIWFLRYTEVPTNSGAANTDADGNAAGDDKSPPWYTSVEGWEETTRWFGGHFGSEVGVEECSNDDLEGTS
jgi:hypothetical protein